VTGVAGMTALVTGASKGIGRALARGLADAGAAVVVNYKTDEAGADRTCAEIAARGGRAWPLAGDLATETGAADLIEQSLRLAGGLDILVNNAGRTMFGPPSAVTPAEWAYVMDTNVRGLFFASVQAAAHMTQVGRGSIINISSCAATLMIRDHAAYTASKAAVEGLTRQLALEYAPQVRVNAVAPGPSLVERNLEYADSYAESWGRVIPMGHIADPATDLVGPVVFLASDAARYLTGAVLNVDGGWSLRGCTPDMAIHTYDSDRQRG